MIAWQHLQDLIPADWIARNGIDRSLLRIKTRFGSELWIRGMDKPMRVEGVQWDGCVLDESCDLKRGTFTRNVLPMLMHRDGWCWRIGIPKRQGPSAKEYRAFYEDACDGKLPDHDGFRWPSSDILSPEAIAIAKASMDVKDFREQFDATFETAGGQLFYAFERRHNVRLCLYQDNLPLIVSSDFNVDPMAWVIGQRRGKNEINWINEVWLRNTNTRQTLDKLWSMYKQHRGGFEFYGDATASHRHASASRSDYQQILLDERFQQAGRTLHYPKADPRRLDRFAACNMLFCNAAGNRRMFVDPKCVHLIDDLESRYCPPGQSYPEDSGDLGHMTDAMGYAVYVLFPLSVGVIPEERIHISLGG